MRRHTRFEIEGDKGNVRAAAHVQREYEKCTHQCQHHGEAEGGDQFHALAEIVQRNERDVTNHQVGLQLFLHFTKSWLLLPRYKVTKKYWYTLLYLLHQCQTISLH